MAIVSEHWAIMKFGDSRQKFTDVRIRITDADALAWMAAADYAAKQATQAGVMMAAVQGLVAATPFEQGIQETFTDDTSVFPPSNDNIYNFDKINVGWKAGLDRYTLTLPARDDTAYNVADDGVTVIITGAGASAATTSFVSAFNNVAEGKNGLAGAVEKMYIQR